MNMNYLDLPTFLFQQFRKTCFKSNIFQKLADDIVNNLRDTVFFVIEIVFNII